MIPDGTDKAGHSLRMLLQFAIKQFPREAVFDFIKDKDRIVASMAAARLQMEPEWSAQTFDYAVQLSGERSPWRRELAAFILDQLCPPKYPYRKHSIPILESLVADTDPDVRSMAIISLGHLESRGSKKLILAALQDEYAGVVDAASFALWALGGRTSADRKKLRAAVERFDPKNRAIIDMWDDD